MKRLMIFVLAAMMSCAAFAQGNQPASTASIEKLLELTETRQMYETTMNEMTRMVDQSTANIMARLPETKQKKFREVMAQLDTIIRDEMNWEKMQPHYVKIYAETFTQQEIDDLAAFYQTPSGNSFIKKQPLVIQRTAALSQERMAVMMDKFTGMMQKAMQDEK